MFAFLKVVAFSLGKGWKTDDGRPKKSKIRPISGFSIAKETIGKIAGTLS